MLRVLQVCNVGQIVGGTAACAWTITKCLPECEHSIAFPSGIGEQTQDAFQDVECLKWKTISYREVLHRSFDVVIFHNTSESRLERDWDIHFGLEKNDTKPIVIQYVHSLIEPARSDIRVFCSNWLAKHYSAGENDVLVQAVPKPLSLDTKINRALRRELKIGRICTPRKSKWPDEILGFYAEASQRFGDVYWEFVGCPEQMKPKLDSACRGKASFFDSGWSARQRLWDWDAMLYHNARVTESFGRTCAESMRAGCIPIVDSQGGFCEQVDEGTGFLCSNRDEFFVAIERLHDAGIRRRRSRKCMQVGDERFSLGGMRFELLTRLEKHAGQAHAAKRILN